MRPRRVARVHVADAAEDEQRIAAARRRVARRASGSAARWRRHRNDATGLERDRPIGRRALQPAGASRARPPCRSRSRASATARASCARPAPSTIAVDSSEIRSCGRRASAAGDREALQLAARQRRRLAIGERLQPDPVEQRVDVDRATGVRAAPTRRRRARAHRAPATRAAGTRSRCRPGTPRPVAPGRVTSPVVGRRPARMRGERRLPGSVRPDDRDHLAAVDLERDVVQHVGARRRDSGIRPRATRPEPAPARPLGRDHGVAAPFVAGVDGAGFGRERGAHPAQRRRGDPLRRARAAITTMTSSISGIVIHQYAQQRVDELVAAVRERRERRRTCRLCQRTRLTPLQVLWICSSSSLRYAENTRSSTSTTSATTGHRNTAAMPDRAADAVPAPRGDADDRAQRAAHRPPT